MLTYHFIIKHIFKITDKMLFVNAKTLCDCKALLSLNIQRGILKSYIALNHIYVSSRVSY